MQFFARLYQREHHTKTNFAPVLRWAVKTVIALHSLTRQFELDQTEHKSSQAWDQLRKGRET